MSDDRSPSLENPAERPSLAGDKADQVLARREDDRESPARRTGAAKHDFLSRNLRRLFPIRAPNFWSESFAKPASGVAKGVDEDGASVCP